MKFLKNYISVTVITNHDSQTSICPIVDNWSTQDTFQHFKQEILNPEERVEWDEESNFSKHLNQFIGIIGCTRPYISPSIHANERFEKLLYKYETVVNNHPDNISSLLLRISTDSFKKNASLFEKTLKGILSTSRYKKSLHRSE